MDKIQHYFATAPMRQKYFLYATIFGLLLYLFAQLMTEILNQQSSTQKNINSLREQLLSDSLPKLQNQLNLKKRDLLTLTTQQEQNKEKLNYLISGLDKLKYTFDDDKNWAKDMDAILKNSLQKNLKIIYLKTTKITTPSTEEILKKTRNIEISGSGNYIDVVAFISYIDNLQSLLKFSKISIVQEEKEVSFLLYIDMYGIEL